MNRSDVKKLQKTQLNILKFVDGFCKEHNLQYFLVFGTLIGAVREQGFIPWDVDIDVAMMRTDYEKLLAALKEKPPKGYTIHHYSTNERHISPHIVISKNGTEEIFNFVYLGEPNAAKHEIYIDIFPVDEFAKGEEKKKKQLQTICRCNRLISLKLAPVYEGHTKKWQKLLKKMISLCLVPISYKSINKRLDKVAKQCNGNGSGKCGFLVDSSIHFLCDEKDNFQKTVLCKFENDYFPIPKRYDYLLKQQYGDYMIPPNSIERWDYIDNKIKNVYYED